MPKFRPIRDRFSEKVTFLGENDCWLWNGARHKYGYGLIGRTGKTMTTAHRVSWLIYRGDIPDGMWVLHKCDNPPCVNPNHLFLGTQDDNMKDCAKKLRTADGTRKRNSKLTADSVVELRRLSKNGVSYSKLSKIFNVSLATAWMAATRRTWKRI